MGGWEESSSTESKVVLTITPCRERSEELVRFVTRLNSDGIHHIGFFGEGEADVRASLAECLIPPADGFFMAYEGDRLVGIFGVDADPEVNRAWLLGPLVEHADWHSVADLLYESVLLCTPASIRDRDLFCDVQNVRVDEFAIRQGFSQRSDNALMTLTRERYAPRATAASRVTLYDEILFESFELLHNTLFPSTYFTARQIVERLDEQRKLFLVVELGRVIGYHFCKIDPDAESGYIDFIGTDPSVRGRGIAADLLASGVDWMLSFVSTRQISLTVNADNVPARKLYDRFGFVTNRVMRGYRKQIE